MASIAIPDAQLEYRVIGILLCLNLAYIVNDAQLYVASVRSCVSCHGLTMHY